MAASGDSVKWTRRMFVLRWQLTCQKSPTVLARGPWVAIYAGLRGSWSICQIKWLISMEKLQATRNWEEKNKITTASLLGDMTMTQKQRKNFCSRQDCVTWETECPSGDLEHLFCVCLKKEKEREELSRDKLHRGREKRKKIRERLSDQEESESKSDL